VTRAVIVIRKPGLPPPDPEPPPTGTLVRITSFPLPALGGSAPFSSNGSSKHTNMASDGKRLYVSGGDWTHSATDGTHSMSLATGEWRQDHVGPMWPDLPAPHALQDGCGIEWDRRDLCFLLWPGSYFPYEPEGAPIREWSRGVWRYKPVANTYTQDVRLFPAQYSGTGCPYGGVFDDTRREILAFGDSSSGFAVRRWNVDDGVRLPDVPFTVRRDPDAPAAYFLRSRPVKIGNRVYIIGYRTNGERAGQKPLMLRVDLYTLEVTECAPPPVNGPDMRDLEIRPAASNGRVVFPFTTGPDGEVRGIHVYTPAADVWATDTQAPEYGNFIGNSICSLPDGRIAFSGGVFGKQQTHMWFIEVV